MKTKIKKIILPMIIVLIAIAGSFASNQSKKENTMLADRIGYIRIGTLCVPTSVICTTNLGPLCTDGTNILYDWNGTDCALPLYRKP